MKILLATDGTKHSEAAAEMVTKLKLGGEDSVRVISVVDMAVPLAVDIYGGYLPDTTELEKTARQSAAKVVEDAIARLNAKLQAEGVSEESLRKYEKLRKPRTSRVLNSARSNMGVFHRSNAWTQAATYGPMKVADKLFPAFIRSRQDWIYGYDVRKVVV